MSANQPASLTVQVQLCTRRRSGRKTVAMPDGIAPAAVQMHGNPALVKALARAFRWQAILEAGRYASLTELAAAERIERGYAGQILRLTLLAPALGQAALDGGGQGPELARLMNPWLAKWSAQASTLDRRGS